ncbi:methyl-accepting chemotaxis protein, partial [Pseudomonas batumici]|uniref:methyl-accepting chemotaxis protein n=1 Tax=Pseudomonas batumici TaxID=226910 RepID=UPI00058A1CB5
MNKVFGNISVSLKLGLGFGLVLLLTTLLALISWNSMDNLIFRSNRTGEVTQLSTSLYNLKVSRLEYMLSNGDETAAQNMQAHMDTFIAQLQKLLGSFKNPESLKLAKEQAVIINNYQQSLNKLRDAYHTRRSAQQTIAGIGESTSKLIDEIRTSALQMNPGDAGRSERLQAIGHVKEQFLQSRFEVRGYSADSTPDTEKKAFNQVNETVDGLRQLGEYLSSSQSDALRQLETALGNYRAALQAYKTAINVTALIRKDLTEQGSEIFTRSDAIYQIQLDSRDREVAQTRTLQLGSTLLALLLGILAAVIISRQITRPIRETLDVVECITAGDLTRNLLVTRRDELGVLQRGIQHMSEALRDLISGVREGVTQIANAGEGLSAVTEQTSVGVNNQKTETDQVATAMHQMTATVQEVARNAEQASQAAADADGEARAGDKVVAEAIAQIERLATEVARS